MNTEVLFERKDNKLIVKLNKDANYTDIKNKIISILDATQDMFDGIESPITILGKRLADNEEQELLSIFAKKTTINVIIEKPKRLGVATINGIFNKDTTITNTKVFTGTVRSGQRVEFEGSVIVLGDVNAGSEVVAEQNITVLGDVRGLVHAGAKGNRSAFIVAKTINPTQLRIADLMLKTDAKVDAGNGYELARVNMGEIIIEK